MAKPVWETLAEEEVLRMARYPEAARATLRLLRLLADTEGRAPTLAGSVVSMMARVRPHERVLLLDALETVLAAGDAAAAVAAAAALEETFPALLRGLSDQTRPIFLARVAQWESRMDAVADVVPDLFALARATAKGSSRWDADLSAREPLTKRSRPAVEPPSLPTPTSPSSFSPQARGESLAAATTVPVRVGGDPVELFRKALFAGEIRSVPDAVRIALSADPSSGGILETALKAAARAEATGAPLASHIPPASGFPHVVGAWLDLLRSAIAPTSSPSSMSSTPQPRGPNPNDPTLDSHRILHGDDEALHLLTSALPFVSPTDGARFDSKAKLDAHLVWLESERATLARRGLVVRGWFPTEAEFRDGSASDVAATRESLSFFELKKREKEEENKEEEGAAAPALAKTAATRESTSAPGAEATVPVDGRPNVCHACGEPFVRRLSPTTGKLEYVGAIERGGHLYHIDCLDLGFE